jgi:hypothetical protein
MGENSTEHQSAESPPLHARWQTDGDELTLLLDGGVEHLNADEIYARVFEGELKIRGRVLKIEESSLEGIIFLR